MKKHEQYNKRLVEWYCTLYDERVNSVDEIPEELIQLLSVYSYKEIIRPLVYKDNLKGLSMKGLALKYSITKQSIRTILSKAKELYENSLTDGCQAV